MLKKSLSMLMMSVITVFSLVTPVLAAGEPNMNTQEQDNQNAIVDNQKKAVLEIMDQLSAYKTKKLLAEATNSGLSQYQLKGDNFELTLDEQLKSLGVKELSRDEALAIGDPTDKTKLDTITPNISVPPSNSNVKWYDLNYSYSLSGKTYQIQELYAQGQLSGTNLAIGKDSQSLYSNAQVIVSNLSYIGSMYAQKLVGTIPVVQWTPYELLFADNSKVTNNSYKVTYRSLSTVCFSYVKLSGASDSTQQLTFVSNKFDVASTHVLAGFNNGVSYTKSPDTYNLTYADDYASAIKAATAYDNAYAQTKSYASSFTYYNHDKSKSLTAYVLIPSFPIQITQ